jgi:hypothetical protein
VTRDQEMQRSEISEISEIRDQRSGISEIRGIGSVFITDLNLETRDGVRL